MKIKSLASLSILFSLVAVTAFGQPAVRTGGGTVAAPSSPEIDAVIEGPETAKIGELVLLDASGSNADAVAWTLCNSDQRYLEFDNSKKLVFATAKPGKYVFLLVAGKTIDGRLQLAKKRFVLSVSLTNDNGSDEGGSGGNSEPAPPVGGGGNVGSKPVKLPGGQFDLAQTSYDLAVKEVKLSNAKKKSDATEIASVYRSIAAAIRNNSLTDAQEVFTTINQKYKSALGDAAESWKEWNRLIKNRLYDLIKSDGFPKENLLGLATAYEEIAVGLEAIE